jgi:hypothetical protein
MFDYSFLIKYRCLWLQNVWNKFDERIPPPVSGHEWGCSVLLVCGTITSVDYTAHTQCTIGKLLSPTSSPCSLISLTGNTVCHLASRNRTQIQKKSLEEVMCSLEFKGPENLIFFILHKKEIFNLLDSFYITLKKCELSRTLEIIELPDISCLWDRWQNTYLRSSTCWKQGFQLSKVQLSPQVAQQNKNGNTYCLYHHLLFTRYVFCLLVYLLV